VIYGTKNYTVLEVGNINLLLSIPHDGNLKPTNIKDRTVDTVIDYLLSLRDHFNWLELIRILLHSIDLKRVLSLWILVILIFDSIHFRNSVLRII
jgi:hypothetical protein